MKRFAWLIRLFQRRPTKKQLIDWHVSASIEAHEANSARLEANLSKNSDLLRMIEHLDSIARVRGPVFSAMAMSNKPNQDLEHALITQKEENAPVILSHSYA